MRHKYNKRKEAFVKSKKPPKRRMKEEKDKDVFKRRKFIKNVDVEKTERTEESSSSSEEEEQESVHGKMMEIFGGNILDNHAIESDSDNDEDDHEVKEGSEDRKDTLDDGSDLEGSEDEVDDEMERTS